MVNRLEQPVWAGMGSAAREGDRIVVRWFDCHVSLGRNLIGQQLKAGNDTSAKPPCERSLATETGVA